MKINAWAVALCVASCLAVLSASVSADSFNINHQQVCSELSTVYWERGELHVNYTDAANTQPPTPLIQPADSTPAVPVPPINHLVQYQINHPAHLAVNSKSIQHHQHQNQHRMMRNHPPPLPPVSVFTRLQTVWSIKPIIY
jgi:hypothetical protein